MMCVCNEVRDMEEGKVEEGKVVVHVCVLFYTCVYI
jgi:hypothetical protein